jgi:hypothetical protein
MAKNESGGGAIHCCVCLNQGRRVEFTTVVRGYAVCDAHVELASRPDFTIFSLVTERRAL